MSDSSETESSAALRLAARAADICVLTQTADMRYSFAENLPPPLREKWRKGCAEEDIFPADFAAQMRRAKQSLAADADAAPAKMILVLRAAAEQKEEETAAEIAGSAPAGQDLCLQFTVMAERDNAGRAIGFVSAGVNISKLREQEEVLQALLLEVSHRSKNLLAIIQSIAAQTARFSRSTAVFLKKFQGRLHSLSSSQDLVTESDWRGARLRDLIYAQTHFYAEALADEQKQGCKISAKGENPYLFPSAALHIGLALHELVINSAAFGALARSAGSIKISCEKIKPAEADGEITELMRLCWQEEFLYDAAAEIAAKPEEEAEKTAAEEPAREELSSMHFGRVMLERIVPAAVNGEAKYDIKNGYIEYILDIPAENYNKKYKNNEWIYTI